MGTRYQRNEARPRAPVAPHFHSAARRFRHYHRMRRLLVTHFSGAPAVPPLPPDIGCRHLTVATREQWLTRRRCVLRWGERKIARWSTTRAYRRPCDAMPPLGTAKAHAFHWKHSAPPASTVAPCHATYAQRHGNRAPEMQSAHATEAPQLKSIRHDSALAMTSVLTPAAIFLGAGAGACRRVPIYAYLPIGERRALPACQLEAYRSHVLDMCGKKPWRFTLTRVPQARFTRRRAYQYAATEQQCRRGFASATRRLMTPYSKSVVLLRLLPMSMAPMRPDFA